MTPARHARASQKASGKVVPAINSPATDPNSFIVVLPYSTLLACRNPGCTHLRGCAGAEYTGDFVRPFRNQFHGVAYRDQPEQILYVGIVHADATV